MVILMEWIGKYMELLKLSVEALTERKMRAGLTILMVTIGTSLLVAVMVLALEQ